MSPVPMSHIANPKQPLHIVIADDHALVRQSSRHLLEAASRPWLVHEADSGAAVLRLLRQQRFGLVILDLAMPGLSGFELIVSVRSCQPEMPLMILTMCADPQVAMRAFRTGARGYVTKDTAGRELVPAVDQLVSGGCYLSPTLAECAPGWPGLREAWQSKPP